MNDDELELPRRKLLAGLGTIGVASAGAGVGTMAFLNDTESMENNVMTAGTLDLTLDWCWFYRGEETKHDTQAPTNPDGPMLELDDVKPGDWGCGVISIHVETNPAWVWFRTSDYESEENGMTEPEREAEGDDGSSSGELGEHINVVAAPLGCVEDDDGATSTTEAKQVLPHGGEDAVSLDEWTTDETARTQTGGRNYCYYKGTLEDASADLGGGIKLGEHQPGRTCYIGFCWCIPKEVGNEIQSDTVSVDLDFYAEQSRHNRRPTNPWNDETTGQ